jgi:NAD(P)H-hydrate epimerase
MLVLTAAQIRNWDAFTIVTEPISSTDLMERAATAFVQRYVQQFGTGQPVLCMAGPGNNGGDALAIARLLIQQGYQVAACKIEGGTPSADFTHNEKRLLAHLPHLPNWNADAPPICTADTVLIDGLFGSGINRPAGGDAAAAIDWMNQQTATRVAIDLPSGLPADAAPDPAAPVVKAHFTFSFQCLKPAMLMPEAAGFLGKWEVLDIGLHPDFAAGIHPYARWVQHPQPWVPVQHYSSHTHKGQRGHALLGAGSLAMMGAAVLAARACLRSGAGLVTVATEAAGWHVLQTAVPEAICAAPTALANPEFQAQRRVKALAVGPGWTNDDAHTRVLAFLLEQTSQPLLIDATGLDVLKPMLHMLPTLPNRRPLVITPHVGEYDRLFDFVGDSFQRLEHARLQAARYHLFIVLKGAYTRIISPDGRCFVNSTGNAGMAKGGSGDVLTGLLAGLLAQGYPLPEAAIAAVWWHGRAGDLAAEELGMASLQPGDVIAQLPAARKFWSKVDYTR